MGTTHIKILYALVALLILGVLALGTLLLLSQKNGSAGISLAAGQSDATGAATYTVGPGPTPSVGGIVTAVDATTMKIKTIDGSTATVLLGSKTTFEIAGPFKDQATIQKELDAYNTQLIELRKDPVKNKAALAQLIIPPTEITYPATLADFKVGDKVLVIASNVDASGAFAASDITKYPPQ